MNIKRWGRVRVSEGERRGEEGRGEEGRERRDGIGKEEKL